MEDRSIYYSGEQKYFPNGVLCITGIACEENFEDYVPARKLLKKVQDLDETFGYKLNEEDMMWIETSEFNIGEVAETEVRNLKLLSFITI